MEQSTIDKFYLWYFLIHIPITLLVDASLVVPREYLPSISLKLLEFHISTNKDFLLVQLPLWLQAFGAVELLFQLPLFVIGAYCLYIKSRAIYPYMLLYGFNASFTTAVCIVHVFHDGHSYGLSEAQVRQLILVYVPYFAIPFVMMVDYLNRISAIVGAREVIVITDEKKLE
ncbi:putative membrane protein [Meyerozyma sp. JA9]|nr:putative membrane protein [Meyerozyma sp. JA9]